MQAQIWCAPNAEWYYTRYTLMGNSYSKITYAGTVTINSYTCQQLNYYSEMYSQLSGTTTSFTISPYYTYTSNTVVFLNEKNTNNFDTLYYFNANPNYEWLLPASYANTAIATCARSKVTVLDTGHQVIQGNNLRWLRVSLTNGFPSTDTIFERIGFLKNYFLQYDRCTASQDYHEGGPLRCYSDNQILNYKKVSYACNYLSIPSNLREYSSLFHLKVYPNPANSSLTVDLNDNNNCSIRLINSLGQVVYQVEYSLERKQEIDISDLVPGIYLLKIERLGISNIVKVLKY